MKLSFIPDKMVWHCHQCRSQLVAGMVELHYLGSVFNVELPLCRDCGAVLITEELAVGNMAEAEALLEDK